jgi:hypothetical protein
MTHSGRATDAVTAVIVATVLTAIVALALVFDRDPGPGDRMSQLMFRAPHRNRDDVNAERNREATLTFLSKALREE